MSVQHLLVLILVDEGQAAATASVAIVVDGHEGRGTTVGVGALTTQTGDLVVLINLVVLQHHQLDLLALVLLDLGLGVVLLLLLLTTTTTQTEHQVQSGLLLDVVVSERATVLQLLAGEDQTLLIWGDTLLVLDLGLDGLDRVGRLHVKRDRLAREGLDENLHARHSL